MVRAYTEEPIEPEVVQRILAACGEPRTIGGLQPGLCLLTLAGTQSSSARSGSC